MRDKKDLEKLDQEARKIVGEYVPGGVWKMPVELNGRYTKSLGMCYYQCSNKYKKYAYKIGLMKKFYESEDITDHDVVEVLIHEYLHVLFPEDGHEGKWAYYAKVISNTSSYKITRRSKYKGFEVPYKWMVYCPICGTQWKFARKNYYVKNASHLIHSDCKEKGNICNLVAVKLPEDGSEVIIPKRNKEATTDCK